MNNVSRQFQYLEKFKDSKNGENKNKKLKWEDAKALLLKNNLTLQRARRSLKQTEDRRKKYWRNYIPGIQGAASLNQRLLDIDQVSLDNLSFSAFLRLRIPNPLTISGEVQALNLAEYSAKKRYILQERQAIVRLYQQFLRFESMNRQQEQNEETTEFELKNSQAIISAIRSSTAKEKSIRNIEEQLHNLRIDLAEMLQVDNTRLTPSFDSLPQLGYRNSDRNYLNDKEYGKLAIQLQAANLESARLRLLQVKLSRYPSLNFSASAPQIFSSSAGSSQSFDPKAISLFGGVSEGLDWTNKESERLKFGKEDYHYTIKQAQSKIKTDKERLRKTQTKLLEMNQQLDSLKQNRASLVKIISIDLSPSSVKSGLEQIFSLDEQIDRLEFQTYYQELQFWVWDEKKW